MYLMSFFRVLCDHIFNMNFQYSKILKMIFLLTIKIIFGLRRLEYLGLSLRLQLNFGNFHNIKCKKNVRKKLFTVFIVSNLSFRNGQCVQDYMSALLASSWVTQMKIKGHLHRHHKHNLHEGLLEEITEMKVKTVPVGLSENHTTGIWLCNWFSYSL